MAWQKKAAFDTLSTIDEFLRKVSFVKRADELGKTEHPSEDVDDNTHDVEEGERSSENEKDVKKHLKGGHNTSNTDDAKAASVREILKKYQKIAESVVRDAEEAATDGGMKVTPTGEDPENETESVKSTKDDPGTDHPANTENSELNGGKYASAYENMPLEQLASLFKSAAERICVQIANMDLEAAHAKQAADYWAAQEAAARGWELAQMMAAQEKMAADQFVANQIANIASKAHQDAGDTAEFLNNYHRFLNNIKAANEGAAMPITPDMLSALPPEALMANPVPPEVAAGGGPGGVGDLENLDPQSAGAMLDQILDTMPPEEIAQALDSLPEEAKQEIVQHLSEELEEQEAAKQAMDRLVTKYANDALAEIIDNTPPEQVISELEALPEDAKREMVEILVEELDKEDTNTSDVDAALAQIIDTTSPEEVVNALNELPEEMQAELVQILSDEIESRPGTGEAEVEALADIVDNLPPDEVAKALEVLPEEAQAEIAETIMEKLSEDNIKKK